MSTRRARSISRDAPLNPFDLASSFGVEIRFIDVSSMEGMFVRMQKRPVILLPAVHHRPYGRLAFSCAHEMGHFSLKHVTKVDLEEDLPSTLRHKQTDEKAADLFASHLLMPRPAVVSAFTRRGFDHQKPTPHQIFAVAEELGVGYSTLIGHMQFSLEIINQSYAQDLLRVSPKDLKKELLGEHVTGRVVVIDQEWRGTAIDLRVGEYVIAPENLTLGNCNAFARKKYKDQTILKANYPGVHDVSLEEMNIDIRVSREHFSGLHLYRFMEEPDSE